jgi:hypothetical protein
MVAGVPWAQGSQKITEPEELRKASYLVESGGYSCQDPDWVEREGFSGGRRNANYKRFQVSCSGTTYSVEWHNGSGVRVERAGWF